MSDTAASSIYGSPPALTPTSLCERKPFKVDFFGSPLKDVPNPIRDGKLWREWRKPSRESTEGIAPSEDEGKEQAAVTVSPDVRLRSESNSFTSCSERISSRISEEEESLSPVPQKKRESALMIPGLRLNSNAYGRDNGLRSITSGDSVSIRESVNIKHHDDSDPFLGTAHGPTHHEQRHGFVSTCTSHYNMIDCPFYTSEVAALKFRAVELEYVNATMESKLRQHRQEIRLFKKDVKGYKRDERRCLQQMKEKEAEISALNEKIAQLVGVLASASPGSSVSGQRDGDKELPLARPSSDSHARRVRSRTVHYVDESIIPKTDRNRFWM